VLFARLVVELSDPKLHVDNQQQELGRTVLISRSQPSSPTATGLGKALSKHPSHGGECIPSPHAHRPSTSQEKSPP
jgi:hypothetical protein